MAGYGLPHEQIGGIIGIDDKTLRKHYKAELMKGKASASLAVAKSLFQKATEDRDTTAMIWWTKTQMGWSERRQENIEEAPPLEIKFIVNEPVGDIKVTNASPRDEETKLIEQQD